MFAGRRQDISDRERGRIQLNKDLNGKKVGSDLAFDCDLITVYTVYHTLYIIRNTFYNKYSSYSYPTSDSNPTLIRHVTCDL